MIGCQGCVTLIHGPFGERLVLIWLVPLVRLVRVGLDICFTFVQFLSGLEDFILESGHFFHLYVALSSFMLPGDFLHRLSANLSGRKMNILVNKKNWIFSFTKNMNICIYTFLHITRGCYVYAYSPSYVFLLLFSFFLYPVFSSNIIFSKFSFCPYFKGRVKNIRFLFWAFDQPIYIRRYRST